MNRTRFHFLNVGKGDCTIVEHPSGNISMIDINSAKDLSEEQLSDIAEEYDRQTAVGALFANLQVQPPTRANLLAMLAESLRRKKSNTESYKRGLTDPVSYVQQRYPAQPIFRFVATHPHMDHLTGLYQLACIARIPIVNFWNTRHSKAFSEEDFENSPYDWRDWQTYSALTGADSSSRVLCVYQGAKNKYFNTDDSGGDGDRIYVWAPNRALEKLASDAKSAGEMCVNHLSYVLNVEHRGLRAVLGGDALGDEGQYPTNTWTEIRNWLARLRFNMAATLLKASHHGHKSGYNVEAVKAMAPRYTIISNAAGQESTRAELYRQWSTYVLSTCWCGNIVVDFNDDGTTDVFTEKDRFQSKWTDTATGYFLMPERKRRFNGMDY